MACRLIEDFLSENNTYQKQSLDPPNLPADSSRINTENGLLDLPIELRLMISSFLSGRHTLQAFCPDWNVMETYQAEAADSSTTKLQTSCTRISVFLSTLNPIRMTHLIGRQGLYGIHLVSFHDR